MKLRGQAGYAMAVLLVAMSIMAVMLTVAMPVWKQASQREKEEELVFRGTQYARAIGLFQRKYANAYPPTIDVLVTERFLRKKYKDPIANDDFALILAGQNTTGAQPTPGSGRGTQPMASLGATSAATGQPSPNPIGGPAQNPSGGRGGTPVGGIMGVTSKSKAESIRLYKGRNHYNEWQFVYVPLVQAPGVGGAPGTAAPGQRGNGANPFSPPGNPTGGQRGRGQGGNGRSTGPGGRGSGPGTFNPFQPTNPQQPIGPPRGRG